MFSFRSSRGKMTEKEEQRKRRTIIDRKYDERK